MSKGFIQGCLSLGDVVGSGKGPSIIPFLGQPIPLGERHRLSGEDIVLRLKEAE